MQLQNKNRIAYLGALTLLFSYAEMLLPRFVPFFRLGLGNIAILLALNISFPEFIILTIIKSIASSMMSGTLISPFFLISISQSLISGLVMWFLFRIKKNWLSIYGISMAGSAISGIIQISLSSIYLGKETFSLLGPVLTFSVISAIITAFLSQALQIPEETPALKQEENSNPEKKVFTIFFVLLLLIAVIFTFMINNMIVLGILLVASLVLQLCTKRKIYLLPHLSMWIFIIFVSLLSPQGRILFKMGFISITKEALFLGIEKSLKLSITAALSQSAASLKISENTLIGLSLAYFRGLSAEFRNQKGNILKRIQNTLSCNSL